MIEETARVVKCQERFAWVETNRKSACDHCSMNRGCGTGAISKIFGEKRARIRAVNKINAHEGENVLIGINESALLKGSLLVYLLPILSLLGFALLGELVGRQLLIENPDLLPIIFGITGLILSMWWVRQRTRGLEQASHYQAIILRRLDQRENCQLDAE